MARPAAQPPAFVRGWRGDTLALLAGLSLPFSFAPYGLWFVAPLALALFFLVLGGCSPRRAAWRGLLFGLAYFGAGVYWVHISIHVFGGASLALALALMSLLIVYLALFPALFGYLASRFFPEPGAARWLLAMPALWTLFEWLRGWLLSGFPWLALGYSQSDSPLIGLAPVLGVFALTFAVVLTAGALLAVWHASGARGRLLAATPPLAVWVGAALLWQVAWTAPSGDSVRVSLVQGSVPQELKWLPEQLRPTVDLYVGLSAGLEDSDLIVWPEAAIPTARHNMESLLQALNRRGRDTQTDFLIGVVEIEADTGRRLNGVVALPHDRPQFDAYYKRHLVPFGEYFPVPGFVRDWIRWLDLPYSDFSSGADDQPPLAVAGVHVGISICYEDVFGEELLGVLPQADLLVNVSNDAWFGGSVAPHQHLQIARLRAVEAGRPLLRGTNNGISAAIGARGQVYARSPQFEPYVLTWNAQPHQGITPYSRWANWPVVLGALAMLAVPLLRKREASRSVALK